MDWKPGAHKSKKQQIFGTQQHNKWPKQKPICGANGTPWQNGQANSTCKPSQRHYALASSHEATIQDAVSEERKKVWQMGVMKHEKRTLEGDSDFLGA